MTVNGDMRAVVISSLSYPRQPSHLPRYRARVILRHGAAGANGAGGINGKFLSVHSPLYSLLRRPGGRRRDRVLNNVVTFTIPGWVAAH